VTGAGKREGGRGKEPVGQAQDPRHDQPQCELYSSQTMITLWFQRIERGRMADVDADV
jgi:hypothetical protein